MGLTHIFLIISDTEHLFIYLLVIWMSSLEKCLFSYLPIFLTRLFGGFVVVCFLLWSDMSSLCVLDINLLSSIGFANIFSHAIGHFLILLMICFVL